MKNKSIWQVSFFNSFNHKEMHILNSKLFMCVVGTGICLFQSKENYQEYTKG